MAEAIPSTLEIAERCSVQLELDKQLIPSYPTPEGMPEAEGTLEPRTAHAYPELDRRLGVDSARAVLTDGELEGIIAEYIAAAVAAARLGYDFVDIKHCHGYLLHEMLSAKTRPGNYGGNFENRTRILREIVSGIRRDAPGLAIGVRLSIYDQPPLDPESGAMPDGASKFTFGLMTPT